MLFAVAGNSVPMATSMPVVAGEWNHVAVVFDAGQLSLWKNGERRDGIGTPFTALELGGAPTWLGRAAAGQSILPEGPSMIGELGEARLYERALNPAEIRRLAQIGP
jgi:hypothetical protein